MTFKEWFEDMCILWGDNPDRWPKHVQREAMDFAKKYYERKIQEKLEEMEESGEAPGI